MRQPPSRRHRSNAWNNGIVCLLRLTIAMMYKIISACDEKHTPQGDDLQCYYEEATTKGNSHVSRSQVMGFLFNDTKVLVLEMHHVDHASIKWNLAWHTRYLPWLVLTSYHCYSIS